MSNISKWRGQSLMQKEPEDHKFLGGYAESQSEYDTKMSLQVSFNTCFTSDQSYQDDTCIQQAHPIKEIEIKFLSSQSSSIYQNEEDLLGTIQIKQNQENKIILFLTQFIEKGIISNYLKNKTTSQTYLLINTGQQFAVTDDIILKLTKSQNFGQIRNIMQKEGKQFDLMNVGSQTNDISASNRSALINMFKAKYFSKTNVFLWNFQSELDFKSLQRDFNSHKIKVYLLDKNIICFVNQDQKPDIISYKNYIDDSKQQTVKTFNLYDDITKLQKIWFNQTIFDKARFGHTQKYKKLFKILMKYGNKYYVTDQIFIKSQLELELYLNFYIVQELVQFVKQLYSNQFQLSEKGELRSSKMEDQRILQHNQTSSQQGRMDSDNVQASQINLQSRISNEISMRNIMKATTCLKEFQVWDFLFLWKNGFKQVVQKLIKDWDIYRVEFQQPIRYLNRLAEYKMQKLKLKREFKIYNQIFKDIIETVQTFIKILDIQRLSTLLEKGSPEGKKYSITHQQNDNQELLKLQKQQRLKIFQQLQSIKAQSRIEQVIDSYINHKTGASRDIPFLTKIEDNRKQSFSQYVAEKSSQSFQSSKLRNIITLVNYYLEQNNNLSFSKDAKAQKHCSETNQSYLAVIEEERVVETRCLGCATFFKINTNIFDDAVNIIPFRVFPSVQQMKEYESQIKDQICSMLNSGGGIILFDCIQHFQKVFIKGIPLNEKSKEQYEQRFTSYLDTFQPKKNIKRCIDIKFVPVVAEQPHRQNNQIMHQSYAGEQSILKQNQTYRLRPYLRNVYVMRIRICPIQGQRVYYWNQNNDKEQKEINKSYLCTAVKDGSKISIKMSKIASFIKQKMRKYYLPQKYKGDVRMCLQPPFSSFNHQCRDPEAGVGICHEQSYDQKSSDLRESSVSNNLSVVDKFKNSSLLIAKKQHFNEIKHRLTQEGFQCQIQQKFQNYKFQSAKNSAMLHYNKKFEDILKKVLQNPKFNFNGRKLILINITNYVKLSMRNEDYRYPKQDFQNLKDWLRKDFPHEQLRLFEFKCQKKKIEYYLQTQTIDSTLFIYYILNKFKEKATFKNPLHLDKMDPEERNERFKQLYNYAQSNHHQAKENLKAQFSNDLNKSTRVQSDLP